MKRLIKGNNAVKKNSKYVTTFDLSAASSGICIISFANVVEAPAAIAKASLNLIFSLITGIIIKLLRITRNKKKTTTTTKKCTIRFLYWLKVNSKALKL